MPPVTLTTAGFVTPDHILYYRKTQLAMTIDYDMINQYTYKNVGNRD